MRRPGVRRRLCNSKPVLLQVGFSLPCQHSKLLYGVIKPSPKQTAAGSLDPSKFEHNLQKATYQPRSKPATNLPDKRVFSEDADELVARCNLARVGVEGFRLLVNSWRKP